MSGRIVQSLGHCMLAGTLLVLLAFPGYVSAGDYIYTDDFTTDKAAEDSYFHSDFLDEFPDPLPLGGFLIYESYVSSRSLSFYLGDGNDSYAWLKYRFPLEGAPGTYSSATVRLDIVGGAGYGWIQCGCSLEGGHSWEWPACGDEGPCTFEFSAEAPSDTVELWFRGCQVSIDDLAVTLTGSTPVEPASWTTIKCLYEGRPR